MPHHTTPHHTTPQHLFKLCRTCMKTLRVKCSANRTREITVSFKLQWNSCSDDSADCGTYKPSEKATSSDTSATRSPIHGFPGKTKVFNDIEHYMREYRRRITAPGAPFHNYTEVGAPPTDTQLRFYMKCNGIYYQSENACG